MMTVTTLFQSVLLWGDTVAAYHSVRLPTSPAFWMMGSMPGTTVGMGATEEVAVTVFLRASSMPGSTIMMAAGGGREGYDCLV